MTNEQKTAQEKPRAGLTEVAWERLLEAVGHDSFRLSRDPLTLQFYTGDFTATTERGSPQVVGYPETTDEIGALLRVAAELRLPVVPYSAGTGLGTWQAKSGGLLLDLRRMNRIVEINDEELYVVVEPGVTYSQLARELTERGLVVSIPDSTPSASVLANHVNFGIGAYLQQEGLGQELVLGVEAVLPDGEVVRTGSGALEGAGWSVRTSVLAPIPDLTGLFLNSHGTLGVVTQVAIRVMTRPEAIEYFQVGFPSVDRGARAAQALARTEIAQRISGFNWFFAVHANEELARQITGEPMTADDLAALRREVDSPEIYFYVGLHGMREEVAARERRLRELVSKYGGSFMSLTPLMHEKYYEVAEGRPQTVSVRQILGRNGRFTGGYDTVYAYCPFRRWAELYDLWMKLGLEAGHPLAMNAKVLPRGRTSTFRFILSYFDNEDRSDRERVARLKGRLAESALEAKVLLGSMPPEAHGDIASFPLYERVRSALDPAGVMHPSRRGAEPIAAPEHDRKPPAEAPRTSKRAGNGAIAREGSQA